DPPPEVEIVVGTTRATSRPDSQGEERTRARKAEGGSAKLMAYGGDSEVEAGGAKVEVKRGMGTSVAPQGPPSPPEPLLPAVVLGEPGAGAAPRGGGPREPPARRGARLRKPAALRAAGAAGRLLRRRDLP